MDYKTEVLKLSPGAYPFATSRQVWIQSREHLCISKAISFDASKTATDDAWKSAYENLTKG